MELSEIINLALGGSLMATAIAALTMKSTVRKAKAEALKAEAEAEELRIDNAEKATRILVENIVKPLKEELNETKKELSRNTREMARLRKALDAIKSCDYRDNCPVIAELRVGAEGEPGPNARKGAGQRDGKGDAPDPGEDDTAGTGADGADGGEPP